MTRPTTERPVGAHALALALCQLARRRGITLPVRPTEQAVRERVLYEAVDVPEEATVKESWTVRMVGEVNDAL